MDDFLNNRGGIPKLNKSNTVTKTLNAADLYGHYNSDEDVIVPALIENAYGPGQTVAGVNTGSWFPPNEVLRIMRAARFILEVPDIQAFFVALIGAAGTYTYGKHFTRNDLDIDIDSSVEGCGGIYEAHGHTTGCAFSCLTAYGTPTSTDIWGSNFCASATGNYTDFVPPFGYGPPISYKDFAAPGGSAGADLEWQIIKDDYGPHPQGYQFGFPPLYSQTTGADDGAGIDLPHWVGDITVDGRIFGSSGTSYPPDKFEIKPGYSKLPEVDYNLYPVNWQTVSDNLQTLVEGIQTPDSTGVDRHGHTHPLLPTPTYDFLLQEPSLPFDFFPAYLVSLVAEPYHLTCAWTFLVIGQPSTILPGDPSLDMWKDVIKAQKKFWAGRRVIVVVDVMYLNTCGIVMVPGAIDTTINTVADFCSDLMDCGFTFGGAVDFTQIIEQEYWHQLFDDLFMFFSLFPQVRP